MKLIKCNDLLKKKNENKNADCDIKNCCDILLAGVFVLMAKSK